MLRQKKKRHSVLTINTTRPDNKQHKKELKETFQSSGPYSDKNFLSPFSGDAKSPQPFTPLSSVTFPPEKMSPEDQAVRDELLEKIYIAKIPAGERAAAYATNVISPIGLTASATVGIVTKLAGAGIVLGTTTLIAATAGGAGVALLTGYVIYKFYSKQALKESAKLIKDNDDALRRIQDETADIENEKRKNFKQLVLMKSSLEKLRAEKNSEELAHTLIEQMNSYIKFLTGIEHHETVDGITRATTLNKLVNQAYRDTQREGPTQFFYTHQDEISNCFTPAPLKKEKKGDKTSAPWYAPWRSPTWKSITVPAALWGAGAATTSISLSYLAITAITAFTVLSIGTGPFAAIILGGALLGFGMYKLVQYSKTKNAERAVQLNENNEHHQNLNAHKKTLADKYTQQLGILYQHKNQLIDEQTYKIKSLETHIKKLEGRDEKPGHNEQKSRNGTQNPFDQEGLLEHEERLIRQQAIQIETLEAHLKLLEMKRDSTSPNEKSAQEEIVKLTAQNKALEQENKALRQHSSQTDLSSPKGKDLKESTVQHKDKSLAPRFFHPELSEPKLARSQSMPQLPSQLPIRKQ